MSGSAVWAGDLGPGARPGLTGQRSFGLRTRLVAAEVMKIRTTRAGWLFTGGFAALSAVAVLWNWAGDHAILYPSLSDYSGSGRAAVLAQAASARTASGAGAMAASMMTSGQFLLVLITLMLGAHVVTSEFAAGTMTSTFLVTPRRGLVIAAKLVTAGAFGMALWAIATVLDGAGTPLFLAAQHLPASAFGSSDVLRAVMMGLLAYVLWALFGLGLGAVLRSQAITAVAAIAILRGRVRRGGTDRPPAARRVSRFVAAELGGTRARSGDQRDDHGWQGVPAGVTLVGGRARDGWLRCAAVHLRGYCDPPLGRGLVSPSVREHRREWRRGNG